VLKYQIFDNFVTLNGTAIVTFNLENDPYLVMFSGAGVYLAKEE
jgi:hypothetical protein